MKKKSRAHQGLSLLFQKDGVPNYMISNGLKEQVQGEFQCKCKEADCYVKQTEHTPWSNGAECGMRELKQVVGQKIAR